MGCIHNIKSAFLHVELPGRIFGDISIKYISDTYVLHLSKLIEDENESEVKKLELSKIFKEGQYLPVLVLSKVPNDKGVQVLLSIKPSDINAELSYSKLRNKMLLWAAISEKSDHCYILDAGIKNCRITLPFKNVENGKEYGKYLNISFIKMTLKQVFQDK